MNIPQTVEELSPQWFADHAEANRPDEHPPKLGVWLAMQLISLRVPISHLITGDPRFPNPAARAAGLAIFDAVTRCVRTTIPRVEYDRALFEFGLLTEQELRRSEEFNSNQAAGNCLDPAQTTIQTPDASG